METQQASAKATAGSGSGASPEATAMAAALLKEARPVAIRELDASAPAAAAESTEAKGSDDAKALGDDGSAADAATKSDAPSDETAPPVPPKPDKLASKFAALARRERQLVERERSATEKLKSVEAYERAKKSAADDPGAALESLGLTYEALTDWVLSDKKPARDPEVKTLTEKLEKLEKDAQDKEAALARANEERAVEDFKRGQVEAVKSAGDKYELVNQMGRHDLVFDVTQEYFKANGKVPAHDEAAQLVEDYLLSEITKYKGVKKLAALFGSLDASTSKAPAKTTDPKTPDSGSKTTKTLTNTLSDAAPSPDDDPDTLSDAESKRRAARLIRWV